jgi:secondary thiamine-phosphate synthase enzyme
MVSQYFIALQARKRGFHLITQEILKQIPHLPETGILNLFIKHTSAGLCINENADPDVRIDFETYLNHIVPENLSGLLHTIEGPDDMPAHIKSAITGSDINIPISKGRLNLGTWQGIFLCEFRNHGGSRKIVASIYS